MTEVIIVLFRADQSLYFLLTVKRDGNGTRECLAVLGHRIYLVRPPLMI